MTEGIIDKIINNRIEKTIIDVRPLLESLKQELKAEIQKAFGEYYHLQHKELILKLLISNGEKQ